MVRVLQRIPLKVREKIPTARGGAKGGGASRGDSTIRLALGPSSPRFAPPRALSRNSAGFSETRVARLGSPAEIRHPVGMQTASRATPYLAVLSAVIAAPCMPVPHASADYSSDVTAPLVVAATANDDVQPKIVAGPSDSHYISYLTGAGYDVALARLDRNGKSAWKTPTIVNDRALSSTVDYGCASDGVNAYVAYATTAGALQCTAVSPAGAILWTTVTSAAAGNVPAQVTVASDGYVWVAAIEGSGTRVQRLDPATGAASFATPVQLAETGASQFIADIEPSENGAVIVSCVRYTTFTGPKILRAHRVEPTGARPWAANGVSVFTTGSLQFGNFPSFISDGAGGAYFAWYTTGPLQSYVQRVSPTGALLYGVNGVAVTATATGAERTDPSMMLGADGRLYVTFTRHTPNSSIYGIYAQCFAKGVAQWGSDGAVVEPLGGAHDALGRVVDEQELAARRTRAPALDRSVAAFGRLEALADQRRDHMRGRRIEVVPRSEEVHRQQVARGEPVLPAVAVEHHHGRLLGDAVGRVGLLGVADPEVVLAERHRRVLGIRADRPDLHELPQPDAARLLDQVERHRHVGVEVAAGVRLVRADATDLRRKVQHDIGPRLAVQARRVGLVGQVVVAPPWHDHVGDPPGPQPFHHRAAKEPRSARYDNTGADE